MSVVPNDTPTDGIYSGSYYAFLGTGYFEMNEGFDQITLRQQSTISTYDVTDALQVQFDVKTFNTKLGLLKDSANQYVTDSSYDAVTDTFPNDSITLSATEFVAGLTESQITSVGKYSSLYSDFTTYVATYFSYVGGFTTLFDQAEQFSAHGGLFDASAFITLISGTDDYDVSAAYVRDLSGSITISNINQLLRYAVDSNVFNNRDSSGGTTAADPSNNANYGVNDGFKAGDLLFIPNGTKITLKVGIDAEAFLDPLNNIGPSNSASLSASTDYTSSNGYFSISTTTTTTEIKRTLVAPLLIKLVD